jgi:deoxyribonuclease-4
MTAAAARPTANGPLLGCHVSIAGGVDKAPLNGAAVGCDAIQIFTKSNRRWKAPPLREAEITAFFENLKAAGIGPVFGHAAYLINLGAADEALYRKSRNALREELERAERLKLSGLVLHPGSHGGAGSAAGIGRVAEAINELLAATPKSKVRILLENTAGQGTSLGRRFEHLADILRRVGKRSRLGVCLDTCHLFAAGYDIRSEAAYTRTIEAFDAAIGLKRLACVHVNDSKGELGSRIDRHEHIGRGKLGRAALRHFLRDPRLRALPKLLETPKGFSGKTDWDVVNLRALRRLMKET